MVLFYAIAGIILVPLVICSGFAVPISLIFMILKLTNHFDYGWQWVMSPMWITACGWIVCGLFGLFGLVFQVASGSHRIKKKWY